MTQAHPDWPDLPFGAWSGTREALHLWTQVLGKVLVAQAPWLNHSWHVTFRVSPRGLITPPIPHGGRVFDLELDFVDHLLRARSSDGRTDALPLRPMAVATFHAEALALLARLDLPVRIHGAPNEIADAVPFAQDTQGRPYDRNAANAFWRALVQADRVLRRFRTGFLGKASPVHLFWGGLDLAVTRFSGRPAPPHPGGIPALPDAITREAYSHEVSSAGFWPGGGGIDYPAFYSYAYPSPEGFAAGRAGPEGAFFDAQLGEFILPYDLVRTAPDPDAALMRFLQDTYSLAADLGGWDRAALECELGSPRRPRPA